MTAGYLLDTNIIAYWFDPHDRRHSRVAQRVNSLPASAPLVTSVVVVGEILYGCRTAPRNKQAALDRMPDFIRTHLPRAFPVARSTAEIYGDLRARLFDQYAPRRRRAGLRVEQLRDPVTSREFGVQENDLWLVSQAIDRNLVLVTHDRMDHIKSVAPELRVEDWAAPLPSG